MNDLHEQAYPYVVAALPADEAEEFEAHLAGCARCRAEVGELRNMTAQLSQSVATEPPAALRGAVLSAIAGIPQQLATSRRTTPHDFSALRPPAQPGDSAQEGPAGTVIPLQRNRPSRLSALLVAAAVLATLGLGGWAFQSQQAAQQSAQEATAKTERLTELLSAQDVQVVTGRVATTGGTGAVVMSASRGEAVFVAAGLPDLAEGEVYEAWTVAQQPVPAGTFTAQDAKTTVSLPPSAFDAKTVAITVEPSGGSPAPTTDPIFTVSVPQQS